MCKNSTRSNDLFFEYTTTNENRYRIVYPADSLTDMVNGKITQVKFYLREPSQTYGGNFKMSFLIYDVPYIIRDDNENIITEGVVVGNGAPVAGESELVFNLDQPYEYTGGHLLIETIITESFDYYLLLSL